jgi:hypothetical protein
MVKGKVAGWLWLAGVVLVGAVVDPLQEAVAATTTAAQHRLRKSARTCSS